MIAYADTSFLVSLFALDGNSDLAVRSIAERVVNFVWTPWIELEFENALRLQQFRGETSPSFIELVLEDVELARKSDAIRSVLLDHSAVLRRARAISNQWSPTLGTRALDVLHVASALEAAVGIFFSFDRRQAALAAAVGLKVQPETYPDVRVAR